MTTKKFSANQHVFQLIRFRPWAWLGDVASFGSRLLLIPLSGLLVQAFFNGLLAFSLVASEISFLIEIMASQKRSSSSLLSLSVGSIIIVPATGKERVGA